MFTYLKLRVLSYIVMGILAFLLVFLPRTFLLLVIAIVLAIVSMGWYVMSYLMQKELESVGKSQGQVPIDRGSAE